MPHAVLFTTLAFVAIALLLIAAWLVPFNLLVRRLAHKYPGYYKKIGQPYVSLRKRSLPNRAKRFKAWRRFAWRLRKDLPSGFPKDRFTRRLAQSYRGGIRFWAAYLALLLLLVLPFDILAVASNWQFTTSKTHSAKQGDDTTHPGPSNFKTTASSTPGVTNSTPSTRINTKTGRTDTTDSVYTYTPAPPIATPAKPANPQLTRADLSEALGSIAPAGQDRTHKQQACEQLIVQQEPASDLGPAPDKICTDANLLTYSTY